MSRSIIVTGFDGYIAGNLIPKLVNIGHNVIGYDRNIPSVYQKNLYPIIMDISKSNYEIYRTLNIVGVIHLAAISGIKDCEKDMHDTIKTNIESTLKLFEFAYERRIPVVFASSQAAKGGGNLYASTKIICEQFAKKFNKRGANINVLRFCNVYGGLGYLEKKSTALSNFIKCKLNDKTAVVHGNGEQKRDFVHVEDICDAIIKALSLRDYNHPIDIGTGVQTSILHLAENIIQCRYKIDTNFDSGVDSNEINTDIAKELLGFEASKKIENVMEEYSYV